MMAEVLARIVLSGVLVAAVIAKLRDPRAAAAAMATYSFREQRSQWAALAIVVVAEAVLAVGVAAGSDAAAFAAGALMLLFAATLGSALLAGRAGEPCGCFGARSTVGPLAIVRNLVLAAAFFALAMPA